ncbi:hypothetical protein N7449_012363 [Penicillium cf. viridicatum]|uniref:Uncharacterized protein n=1 Tax=Penicillium cf. viridicatum TaxID=2972119 RepID=A0A9W9LXZ6_9EURO|nr:hypothetical protein N7449_012363 [Penicillium cf. viridicatum]
MWSVNIALAPVANLVHIKDVRLLRWCCNFYAALASSVNSYAKAYILVGKKCGSLSDVTSTPRIAIFI